MRTSVKVLIGVLAVVAALVAAEFGARAYAGSQVDKFYQGLAAAEDAEEPGKADVSFGATPLLLAALTGSVPEITMSTPDTMVVTRGDGPAPEVTGMPATSIDMEDVRPFGGLEMGKATVRTEIDSDAALGIAENIFSSALRGAIEDALQDFGGIAELGSQLVELLAQPSELTTDPQAGTIEVAFGPGALRAVLDTTGEDVISVRDVRAIGIPLPETLLDDINRALEEALAPYVDPGPGHLGLTDIGVTEGGIEVTISGSELTEDSFAALIVPLLNKSEEPPAAS